MKEENNAESIGPYLIKIREQLGFSLQDIASKTKISLPYLEHLEKENFPSLPNDVFVKGFLRSYAKVLGLEEQEVLERFQQWKRVHEVRSFPENEKEEAQTRGDSWSLIEWERIKSFFERENSGRQKILLNLLIGILVIMGGLVLVYKKKSSELPINDFNSSVVLVPPAATEPISIPPATSIPSTVTAGGLMEGKEKAASLKDQNLHLFVQAIDRSWISVVIDDGITKEYSLHPEDKVSLQAEKHFILNIGNAGGVKVTLNGKSVGPFGKKGEIVKGIKLE